MMVSNGTNWTASAAYGHFPSTNQNQQGWRSSGERANISSVDSHQHQHHRVRLLGGKVWDSAELVFAHTRRLRARERRVSGDWHRFMIMGIGMAITSSIRYHKTVQQIDTDQFEPAGTMFTILGVVAAPFGMILVGYLMCPARTFEQAAVNCRVIRSRPSFLRWNGPGLDRLAQRNHKLERCRLKTSDR